MAEPRLVPFCDRGCAQCTVGCATLMAMRNELTRQLAIADAELLRVCPAPRPTRH